MQCSRPVHDKSISPTQVLATLRDLQKGTVYYCVGGRNILRSSSNDNILDTEGHTSIIVPSTEPYIAELELQKGQSSIRLISGKAFIEYLPLVSTQASLLSSGQVLALGHYCNRLEFKVRSRLRKLPRNPLWGFKVKTMDVDKKRSYSALPHPPCRLTSSLSEPSLTSSYQMNISLQQTLKRVSREVNIRKTGEKDPRQPLPPIYEQVGNSIGYQLLLQSHPNISEKLISCMYPLLKELHTSSEWLFTDYLDSYNESLKMKATPQCLHPSDIPTIKFLVDLCVHVSALPPDSQHHFLKPDPSPWMRLLAIFCASQQNRQVLVDYRCPSKVVGCMNLISMADNKDLQCFSWEVLCNVITIPTPLDKKPSIHIQALTLLLSLLKQQLDQDFHRYDLIKVILTFLNTLSQTVRTCATTDVIDPDHLQPYSQSYAREIFLLIEEGGVREVVMDLPEFLQKDEDINLLLQNILISMAPLPTPLRKVPPPKPKRSRCRTQLILNPPPLQDITEVKSHQVHRKLPEIPNRTKPRSKSTENLLERSLISYDIMEQSLPPMHFMQPVAEPPVEQTSGTLTVPSSLQSLPPMHLMQSVADPMEILLEQTSPSRPALLTDPEQSLPTNLTSNPRKPSRSMTVQQTASNPDLSIDYSSTSDPQDMEQETDSKKPLHSIHRITTPPPPGPTALSHYNRVSLKKNRGSYIKAVTASQQIHPNISTDNEEEHITVITALSERKELLSNISDLWRAEKSLQAVSNCVLSCFFNGCTDIPLFIDCLTCFHSHTKHWTVGVCVVLLPYMRQVMSTQHDIRHLKIIFNTFSLIINKFSTVILSIKKKKATRADTEQKQACYHELHLVATTLSKINHHDIVLIAMLDKFRQILAPFVDPLC